MLGRNGRERSVGGADSSSVVIQRRVSAGSITSSISKFGAYLVVQLHRLDQRQHGTGRHVVADRHVDRNDRSLERRDDHRGIFANARRMGHHRSMTILRVHAFSISLDGYGAGPDQDIDNPLGIGGMGVHDWVFPTATFQNMHGGGGGGATGPDDDFAAAGFENVGAWILGRNMFGPIRGDWGDEAWTGWWGDEPPYHCPVFVLTHHPRPSLEMAGGTTFHFVTGGHLEALDRAVGAAGDADVRVGGGVATVRQYLSAGLVDRIHLAIAPVLLGRGEHLLAGLDLLALGYEVVEHVPTSAATHVVLARHA
jgi:dihydrofolate reductase